MLYGGETGKKKVIRILKLHMQKGSQYLDYRLKFDQVCQGKSCISTSTQHLALRWDQTKGLGFQSTTFQGTGTKGVRILKASMIRFLTTASLEDGILPAFILFGL